MKKRGGELRRQLHFKVWLTFIIDTPLRDDNGTVRALSC